MLYLIVGIVLGAAFHEFWHDLFVKARNLVSSWMSDKPKGEESSTNRESSTNSDSSSTTGSTTASTEPPKEQTQS